MPLHGKVVVIKRSGGDGTEFPLTATCLFGRKPDCDIRIQLPQVSKEHCRIDLNENKEVILTNLSSVNPTRVNGEALQQSERLKHGDVITIIDRSFRFEYPPAPTPKKRSSAGGKSETLKVLQAQQVVDIVTAETGEKRNSEVFTDGTNDNFQQSLEKTVEVESKEDSSLLQNKTNSPFNDLYQMIKKSLDVKTPRKSSASLLQTPASRFCTPKPGSVQKNDGKPVISTEDMIIPKKDDAKVFPGADEIKGEVVSISNGTPKSVKKQRKSFQVPSEMAEPAAPEHPATSEATLPQKRNRVSPQRYTASEVIDQVSAQTSKSPLRRRSKEATPVKASVTKEQEEPAMPSPKTKQLQKASPRNSGKTEKVKDLPKKRKSGELAADLPTSRMKKKRVSFGGALSPELFDKRLPPDSPLRKGATPRRSLCLSQPKLSLLRRASVIGFLKEFEDSPNVQRSPAKKRTPSPKKSPSAKNASPKTPTPGKKSPKSKSPSPKAASPGKKSPKSRSPSPKAASPGKKTPKSKSSSPKAASPGTKSPKSRTPSPKTASAEKKSPKSKTPSPTTGRSLAKSQLKSSTPGQVSYKETPSGKKRSALAVSSPSPKEIAPIVCATPAKTPCNSGVCTSTGRFSVSRISTPSPVAEDVVTNKMPLVTVTPKIPLRRKSMKSTSRKTPSISRSAVKVMRRSGISRASIKVRDTWVDVVKFGQTKAQVAAPAKIIVPKKTAKKTVSKPQTPARKLKGYVSTGHANSPVTIVVGRAHKQKVVHPTGAAPRVVTNTALFKKNMKMDEDLSGISEMFKTPVNERRRKSVIKDNSATETPVGVLSVVEPSVLNTPEEPGEMMVSPLSVASTVKGEMYNSEAVQRLLNGDQDSSFISEIPALEIHSESTEQQCTDVWTTHVTTPKQKPEQPESLTGVKRIMKTPRQKAEPLEDLRGKILKTPKQKVEQQECLTGVKRIMKTPRQKAEPVEDIRGKLLATPKQKPEQQECLTGVKRIFKTPQQEPEPLEDLQGKCPQTPRALEAGDVSLDGIEELQKIPAHMQESEDLSEMTDMKTPNVKSSPLVCLTDVKRIMKTPKEKSAPVEDMVGVKRLMKTPREKAEPVEENFGIKALMKSPRLRGNAPVEDFEGLQELMEEVLTDSPRPLKTDEVEDHPAPPDRCVDIAKELDFACGEPQDDTASDVIDNVPQVDMAKETDANEALVHNHIEEVPSGHDNNESSDAMETISQAAVDESLPVEQPKVDAVDETLSEEQQPEVETATGKVTELEMNAATPDHEKKSVRGRRAKTVKPEAAEDKQEAPEHSEDPVAPAPVRGRRGKKTEAPAPSTVRQTTRNRGKDVKLTLEESAPQSSEVALKPKRGRNAKKASEDQVEMVKEVACETEMVPEVESDNIPPLDVDHKANDSAAPQEKAVSKPKRTRKAKQESEQSVSDVPCDDVPQADVAKDTNEVCSDQQEVVPSENNETKSIAMETVSQAPVTESLPALVTDTDASVVQKKSVRGRRAKMAEAKTAEDKQEAAIDSEDPVVPAPVRGRRGKKTEATAPPAVRQTTRTRNTKSKESTSDTNPETQPMTEISTEAVSDQTSQEENVSASPVEEADLKPVRGRKSKQTPVEPPQPEPEKSEVVSEEQLMADPQLPVPTVGKPRRGRKTKTDVEQNEVAEDTVVTEETKQQSQPPVRAKRGRNAKQEAEKQENDGKATSAETLKSQEPVKKSRRTRKAEQDNVEPREDEIQTAEMVVPKEAEAAPVDEPLKMSEQVSVAAKPRRGGRKAQKDTESEIPVESTEVPAVSSTDKPKRVRRGKQVTEDVDATIEVPEGKPDREVEAEEKKTTEPDVPVIKPSRARGVKTVKNDVSNAIPAKRARRGAALPLEETNPESTVQVSESVPTSVEPPKRGRRAAAKPTTDESALSCDQANPSEDLSNAVVEDTKKSKRSVKWKAEPEVFQIPKETPVKAVRGRRSKLGDQVEPESKNVSKAASKTEEKDLSDEVVEAQPIKRARRGAKVTDDTESSSKVKKGAEAETQPKPRRGRTAKK
ncbi:proliferation marker protein Ki-67 [Seriola aureovittata]|uniref:proliferation marker protein Ki-67 n=2 Tax=Seriola TaxID=8160 RepID=UPI0024BE9EF8|nr:proliferation marker protein Ki-67 [Seriola aureovittata]